MSAAADSALARLEGIAGAEGFRADQAARAEAAVDGVAPACVLAPGSAEAVAEIIACCAAEKLAVIPLGAGTKRGIGMPPARYDVALRTARLARILAYDAGDLTLAVEAGISLVEVQRALAARGQRLPLCQPFYERATIGGALAANLSSPLRQGYGAARDFVIGMEFVTGEGRRAKSGGRVVKNVTGYDLHKLLIGSLGTLAVITAANFRTFPEPPEQAGYVAAFAEAAGALALRRAIVDSPLAPLALEILSPAMARLLDPGAALVPAGAWTVAAAAGGHASVVTRHGRDLEQMARAAGAAAFRRLAQEENVRLWAAIREFPAAAAAASPAATIVRMAVLPSRFAEAVAAVERFAAEAKLPAATLVRGAGFVYAAFTPPADDLATLGRVACSAAGLQNTAAELGGSSLVEFAPLECKKRLSVWGAPRADAGLMRRLKAVFDPAGILAPGRYAGGL